MYINVETICGCSLGVEYTKHGWVFDLYEDEDALQHYLVIDVLFLRFVINF